MTPAPVRTPSLLPQRRPALRRERHFGDRVMQCFAHRPGSVAQMLTEAVARNGAGESLVFVDGALEPRLPPMGETGALRQHCIVGEGPGGSALAAWLADAPVIAAHAAAEQDVAAILYTSGTTGRPKGAMLTHLNIVHSAMHYELAMSLTELDRSTVCVPLSHVTGLIAHFATMLRCAGTLLILPAFKAADFLALVTCERGTHTVVVPAMYTRCLLRTDLRAHDLRAWRVGAFGGAPMPPATIAELALRLPGLILINAYGATETTSAATITPADAGPAHGPYPASPWKLFWILALF